jgi:Leucine-rich repeat (LRR) protein
MAAPDTESHQPSSQVVNVNYSDKKSLQNILCSKNVQLIKPEYLIYLHNQGMRMPKCQDVPKQWILNVDGELDWDRLEIISVSYCWISKSHPDPYGFHLETLYHLCSFFVAGSLRTAKPRYELPGKRFTGPTKLLMNKGWCLGSGDGRPVGVFIDWMSVPQDQPKGTRTNEETAAFKMALKNINIWYGHKDTTTWRLTCLPAGAERAGYDESGWPTFERCIAGIISGSHKMLLIDERARTALKTADGDYLQLSLEYCDRDRQAPITPEAFTDLIQHKKFTNGADRDAIVIPRYIETFETVIGDATALDVQNQGFRDQQAEDIMNLMRTHGRVKSLNISGNMISVPLGDWAALAIDLKLTHLDLSGNPLSGDIRSMEPLVNIIELTLDNTKIAGDIQAVESLVNLTKLHLYRTRVSGDIKAVRNLIKLTDLLTDEAQLTGDIQALENLVNLHSLNLSQTQISGDIKAVENLVKLNTLLLYETQISGDIKAVENLVNLVNLELNQTQISGDIKAVRNLVKLTDLRLCDTQVRGDIQAVENLVNLDTLYLYETKISGDIKAMRNLVKMTDMNLNTTKVTGDIQAVENLVNLDTLDLRETQISGGIKALENLVNLEFLNLKKTQISGDIKAVEALAKLTKLDLSRTGVSGDGQAVRNRRNWKYLGLPSASAELSAPRAAIPTGPLFDWRAISAPSGTYTAVAAQPTPATTPAECPQS